jgi:putative CocE/NonD family hydrolase
MRVGDHGGPEIAGLLTGKSPEFDNAMHWLDHYVRGTDNGIENEPSIQLEDIKTTKWHTYRDWSSVGKPTSLPLGAASAGALPTGTIGGSASTWTGSIKTGTDTVATSGIVQVNNPNFVLTSGVAISKVNRADALVWNGAVAQTATLMSGEPHLHITVTPSAASGTFFAYLYDVDPASGGALMSFAPYSFDRVTPGTSQPVDIDLDALSWTVAQGHHLALVIDTVDSRYFGHNPTSGATLQFGSTDADPATLAIPSAG